MRRGGGWGEVEFDPRPHRAVPCSRGGGGLPGRSGAACQDDSASVISSLYYYAEPTKDGNASFSSPRAGVGDGQGTFRKHRINGLCLRSPGKNVLSLPS